MHEEAKYLQQDQDLESNHGISTDSQHRPQPQHQSHQSGNGHYPCNLVTLTAKEYESLYLTAKDARPPRAVTGTFGNPLGIGTIALVLVVLPWSVALCELGGTSFLSLFVIAPGFIFVGFVLLNIAAIFCWIQGLTFPSLLFFTYGGFSGLLWYLHNPLNEIYTTVGGVISNGSATGVAALGIAATAVPFVRAVSILLIPFCIVSGIFTIAACRTNLLNVILLLGLTFFYGLISASHYHIASGDLPRSIKEQHAAGGFGIVSSLAAIWLTIHLVLASVGFPVNIPIFDLSTLFLKKKQI